MDEKRPSVMEFCPNIKDHADKAHASVASIPARKEDMRSNYYRQEFRRQESLCDWCNPPCPTCGTRRRRDKSSS